MENIINSILEDYIGPTIFTLVAVGILYSLWKGLKGFWDDSEGDRLASVYIAVAPIAVMVGGIKISLVYDLAIWQTMLTILGLFFVAFRLGALFFKKSRIFNNIDENDR